MARKSTGPTVPRELSPEAEELKAFWRQLVKGYIDMTDDQGMLRRVPVPMDLRLRASELLRKVTIPSKAAEMTTPQAVADVLTTTPDILRVAQMLEHKVSDEDIRKLFEESERHGGSA